MTDEQRPEHVRIGEVADRIEQLARQMSDDDGFVLSRDTALDLVSWLRDEQRTWAEYPASDNAPSQQALTFTDGVLSGLPPDANYV